MKKLVFALLLFPTALSAQVNIQGSSIQIGGSPASGGGATLQVNGTDLLSQSFQNLVGQNGLAFSNPSGGLVNIGVPGLFEVPSLKVDSGSVNINGVAQTWPSSIPATAQNFIAISPSGTVSYVGGVNPYCPFNTCIVYAAPAPSTIGTTLCSPLAANASTMTVCDGTKIAAPACYIVDPGGSYELKCATSASGNTFNLDNTNQQYYNNRSTSIAHASGVPVIQLVYANGGGSLTTAPSFAVMQTQITGAAPFVTLGGANPGAWLTNGSASSNFSGSTQFTGGLFIPIIASVNNNSRLRVSELDNGNGGSSTAAEIGLGTGTNANQWSFGVNNTFAGAGMGGPGIAYLRRNADGSGIPSVTWEPSNANMINHGSIAWGSGAAIASSDNVLTLGGTPTAAVNANAGTGATASITGSDTTHLLQVNMGTSPATGNIVAVTFGTAKNHPTYCTFSAAITQAANDYSRVIMAPVGTTGYVLSFPSVAPTASATYTYTVVCP